MRQKVSYCLLHWGHSDESHKLMNLTQLRCERGGRNTVAGFPAGDAESFAERKVRKTSLPQARVLKYAVVLLIVENQMLVDLITANQQIVLLHQLLQGFKVRVR